MLLLAHLCELYLCQLAAKETPSVRVGVAYYDQNHDEIQLLVFLQLLFSNQGDLCDAPLRSICLCLLPILKLGQCNFYRGHALHLLAVM